jgi:hypothetical protein
MNHGSLVSSCRAKIGRADEHLRTLNDEMDRWGDLNPMSFGHSVNRDGTEHLFHLQMRPPPDVWRWAQLFGDAIHNLRCALDHIVYALAVVATGDDPPQDDYRLELPICDSGAAFKKRQDRIRSLTLPMQAAVEGFQPYNRRQERTGFASLEWLRTLDDIDKHRALQLAVPRPIFKEGSINAERGTFKAELFHGPMVHGAQIVRVTLQTPDPNLDIDLKLVTGICVAADDGRPIGITHLSRHMRKEVVDICRTLSEFIPI